MHQKLCHLPPWLNERTVEYIVCAHVSGGSYNFSTISTTIRTRIRQQLAMDKGIILLPNTWLAELKGQNLVNDLGLDRQGNRLTDGTLTLN